MSSKFKQVEQNCILEWAFSSRQRYDDPFNDVEVSAIFTDPDGEEKIVPAFWSGGNLWSVRYSSHKIGMHRFRIESSDEFNCDLNG